MITTKIHNLTEQVTFYTDKLGVFYDGSPKLLGHVSFDHMNGKGWYAKVFVDRKIKSLPKKVLCKTKYKAIRYMVMAEQRLVR